MHTTCSDGALSPLEIVDEAKKNGVSTIAIADHDNTAAYTNELFEYAKSQEIEILKVLREHCDSEQTLLSFCNRLTTAHKSEPETSLLKPFICAYNEISEKYAERMKREVLEHWKHPLGAFERFAEFTYQERVLILYLYQLQKTHEGKKDIRHPNHKQNWSILTEKERTQLAYHLYKLYDEKHTYRKYMPCVHPQEAEDKFLLIIAQLTKMKFYEAQYQLDDMLRFVKKLTEINYEHDQQIYSPVIAQIKEAYELMLEVEKGEELSFDMAQLYEIERTMAQQLNQPKPNEET
jgi:hypothetical protein